MTPPSYEAAFLQSAAKVLEDYLLSDVLFWPLQGGRGETFGGGFGQLTPGNILLSKARLGKPLPPDPALIAALQEIEKIRQQWKSAWLTKCSKEWDQRMRLWLNYLDELSNESRQTLPADFSFHVRQRVILHLLGEELSELSAEKKKTLQDSDAMLRSLSQMGEFVWEKSLQEHFPVSSFWYLYLKTGKEKSE